MLEDTQLVWVRDPVDGYIQGRITEIGAKDFEVTPIDRKFPKRTCHHDDIHSSCDGPQDHDDNCKYCKYNTLLNRVYMITKNTYKHILEYLWCARVCLYLSFRAFIYCVACVCE